MNIDYWKLAILVVCVVILIYLIMRHIATEQFRYSLKYKQIVRYKISKAYKTYNLGRIIKIDDDGVILCDCKTLQTYFVQYKFIYPLKRGDTV